MSTGLYLEFVTQTGTLTFGDGTTTYTGNYRVTRWEQNAGAYTDSGFDNAREVIYFDVFSTTAADVFVKVRNAEAMCADIDYYNVYPYMLAVPSMYYSAPGQASLANTSSANRARLLSARLYPPSGYPVSASGGFILTGFRLEIVRTPYLKQLSAFTSSLVSSIANGSVATTGIAPTQDQIELNMTVSGTAPSVAANGGMAFLALGTSTGLVNLAVNGGTALAWTSVNDAANNAVHTNVLRYTPTATTESTSGTITISPTLTNGGVWAIYFSARNNSATTSFLVRFRFSSSGGVFRFNSPLTPIAANATAPRYYFGGIVAGRANINGLNILATASAASGTLDIDNVVLVNVQDNGRVLGIVSQTASGLLRDLIISPNTVLSLNPFVDEAFGVIGDARLFFKNVGTRSLFLRGAYLKCTGTSWREVFAGTPTSNNWTFLQKPHSHIGD
jgi:hypothetical protein